MNVHCDWHYQWQGVTENGTSALSKNSSPWPWPWQARPLGLISGSRAPTAPVRLQSYRPLGLVGSWGPCLACSLIHFLTACWLKQATAPHFPVLMQDQRSSPCLWWSREAFEDIAKFWAQNIQNRSECASMQRIEGIYWKENCHD